MLIKTSAMLSADWLTCAYLFLEGDYWWVLDVLIASWAASRLFLYDVATSDGFRLFSAFRLSCCIISLHLSLTSAWRLDLHWDFCYSFAALFFLGWLTDSELWSISLDVCICGLIQTFFIEWELCGEVNYFYSSWSTDSGIRLTTVLLKEHNIG